MSDRLILLKDYLKESPNDSFLLFALAKEYEKVSDEKNSLLYYQTILENDPDYVGVYYHLGKLHERNLRFSEAIKIYKQGIQIASKVKDNHSLNELNAAKMNLDDEDEDY
jgi:tetratricopeptide (TPR) repeat protein